VRIFNTLGLTAGAEAVVAVFVVEVLLLVGFVEGWLAAHTCPWPGRYSVSTVSTIIIAQRFMVVIIDSCARNIEGFNQADTIDRTVYQLTSTSIVRLSNLAGVLVAGKTAVRAIDGLSAMVNQ